MSQQLVEILGYATSQIPEHVKIAEQKYAEWSSMPGFYPMLAQILADTRLEEKIHLMALIWLKNAVQRLWRPSQPNALPQEDKNVIKSFLLSAYPTTSPALSKQMAEIFARIVRCDPLNGWPQLLPELMQAIQDPDNLRQSRALLMLLHVIKGLSARPTLQERKHFEQVTAEMYQFMANAWLSLMRLFMTGVQEGRSLQELSQILDKAVLSLKIIKRMNLFGLFKPEKNEMCNEFWRNFLPPIDELLHCRMYLLQKPEYQPIMETFEKYIVRHMKLLYEYQERHVSSFLEFAPAVLEFAYDHVFGEKSALVVDGSRVHFQAFAIYCFNLIKSQLGYDDKVPKYSQDIDKAMVKVTDGFFNTERLQIVVDKLISVYFLMTEVEMNIWESDPEEYVGQETGDSWKYCMRSSAETLFVLVCKCYNKEITPRLQILVNAAQQLELTAMTPAQDVLYKEAIYNAVGQASFRLFDELDFDYWFTNFLVQEMQIKDPALKIIKKRAIWLIGTWTAVKFNRDLRPAVYEMCGMLLDPEEDLVVRLVTSQTLKNILDDFEFTPEQFLPYLEVIFVRLYNLLQNVDECETKMNILKTMSFIIQKMSFSIKGHANQLVEYLPILWEQSQDNYMQKTVIVSTMRDIIQALGGIPETLLNFIYDILQHSTNVEDDMHVYMIDEGLELWLKTIQHCKVPNENLVKLTSNLIPIIESSSTYLRTCLHIVQAYILLIPEYFITNFGPPLVNKLMELQQDMRSEGIIMIHSMYIVMLKTDANLAVQVLRPALIEVFKGVYQAEVYVSELRIYLQIIARVLAMHPNAFGEILQAMGKPDGFEKIFEVMLEKFHLAQNNEERKLLALAVGSIMTKPVDAIYLNMATIMEKLHKAMLNIVQDDEETGQKIDSLILSNESDVTYDNDIFDADEFDESTPHFERLQKLGLKDPIHTVPLHEFIQNQINTIRQQLGDERYQALMMSIDHETLNEASLFLNLYIPIPDHNSNRLESTMD
ncbi:importin-11 [Culicoides brevitarsis]|uniref:importin-11 n=1 Tax=Culicoides brevitarsis TaxID=469753 RepID=UPI00307C884A